MSKHESPCSAVRSRQSSCAMLKYEVPCGVVRSRQSSCAMLKHEAAGSAAHGREVRHYAKVRSDVQCGVGGKLMRNAQARSGGQRGARQGSLAQCSSPAVKRGAQSAMPGAIPKPEAPCRAAHPLKTRAMHPIPKQGASLHPVAKPRAMPSPRLSARRLLPHPPRCSPRHDFPGRAALTPSASSTVAEKSQKPVRVPSGPGASEGE